MLFPLRPDELVEVVKRRTGISYAEVAARMGWKPGRLDSYLHRMRAGREPKREELDLLAAALADPRHILTNEIVIRNLLHSAGGIPPTPFEVEQFLVDNFPDVMTPGTLAYVLDSRWFFRWVSPGLINLVAAFAGMPPTALIQIVHGWTLDGEIHAATGVTHTPDSGPRTGARTGTPLDMKQLFAIEEGMDWRPALHIIEVFGDEKLGLQQMFDHGQGGTQMPGDRSFLLENQIRYVGAMWPDFQSSDWFAPIHQRLLEYADYTDALTRSMKPIEGRMGSIGVRDIVAQGRIGSAAGELAYVFQESVYDRRLGLGRILL